MIETSSMRRHFTVYVCSLASVGLLGFALSSCGGTASTTARGRTARTVVKPPSTGRSLAHGALGAIPQATAVPMTPTPGAALARCRQSRLLRSICPRQVPLSLKPTKYDLADGCANAPNMTIASSRCSLPVWSYETFAMLPDQASDTQVSAWDGRGWFFPSYAPMDPPPYHVHVDIEAAAGSPPPSILGPSFAGAVDVNRLMDALLNPDRARAVRLGRVHWYGHRGELVLAPTGAGGGGEEAGHLIFYFTARGVNYDISLHAWAPKVRITGHGMARSVNAPGAGPALPHVIATLKAIAGSALTG